MNEQTIFLTALEKKSDEERAAWLDEACGQDADLRQRVEALLAGHADASFLERPVAELNATLVLDGDHSPSKQGQHQNESTPATQITIGCDSVLQRMGNDLGQVPQVSLHESNEEGEGPLVRPTPVEIPQSDVNSRYQFQGELARGGMGRVVRGRDVDLGRDLAVKMLLDEHRDKPEVLQRFVEEAQIGGQLQHPGIAPVYDLGQLKDRTPFFTMKLVKGRTLSALLVDRNDAADERPKFIGIFEQICQTMAYAHSRGVIHRDLKPANIMVGAFGEVQVMDWGLAKVLSEGGVADEKRAHKTLEEREKSVVQTLRSAGSDTPQGFGSQTQMGSVMGTPAYMSPEQALGEIDRLDERSDVFGLGAILCEILTGRAPYIGNDNTQVYRMAVRGQLDLCFESLDQCGADREIVALAKSCLVANQDDRPRNARHVADAVETYLESVEERLRAAEIARVEAQTKSIEERRRRKLQLGLVSTLLVLVLLAGSGGFLYWQQQRNRQEGLAQSLGLINTLRQRAEQAPLEIGNWREAITAVEQAKKAHAALGDAQAESTLNDLEAAIDEQLNSALQHRAALQQLVEIRAAKADDQSGLKAEADYQSVFKRLGIDVEGMSPVEAAERIKGLPSLLVEGLSTALDEWASTRRLKRANHDGARRLIAIAKQADPEPWRNKLRDATNITDRQQRLAQLKQLEQTIELDGTPAVTLNLLGVALKDAGDLESAERLLRRAYQLHTEDAWLAHDLAELLNKRGQREEAVQYYMAARALRPETAHELAHALINSGRREEGLAIFRELVQASPTDNRHLACLGRELNHTTLLKQMKRDKYLMPLSRRPKTQLNGTPWIMQRS